MLDGDNLRDGLNFNLGFSKEDRHENIRRAGEVAAILSSSGFIVISSFITPLTIDREVAKKACNDNSIHHMKICHNITVVWKIKDLTTIKSE